MLLLFFFSTTKPYLSLALCLAAQYLGNPRHTHTHTKRLALPFWCRWNHLGVFLNHFCFILIRPMHTFTVVFTQLNVAVICVALHLEILEGIYCTSLKKKMDLLFGDRFKFRLLTVFFFFSILATCI